MSSYEFNIETIDGAGRGAMKDQPALPEPGDILELQNGPEFVHWQVRTRRFTPSGRVVVIVDRV